MREMSSLYSGIVPRFTLCTTVGCMCSTCHSSLSHSGAIVNSDEKAAHAVHRGQAQFLMRLPYVRKHRVVARRASLKEDCTFVTTNPIYKNYFLSYNRRERLGWRKSSVR
jgi:hypothetical protein